MIVKLIDEKKTRFGVESIVTELKSAGVAIAPSAYDASKARPPLTRSLADAATTEQIRCVHAANMSVYRARKARPEMHRAGAERSGLIHHCDRGVQCVAIRFLQRPPGEQDVASAGSRRDFDRNAMAETFNSLYKAELARHQRPWRRIGNVKTATAEHIDWTGPPTPARSDRPDLARRARDHTPHRGCRGHDQRPGTRRSVGAPLSAKPGA